MTGTVAAPANARSRSSAKVRNMMPSTYRESTRAVSSGGSPRAIWLSLPGSVMTCPPSCTRAASNETRVRVEAFSNTRVRVFPASVVWV